MAIIQAKQSNLKIDLPKFSSGDTVKVFQKIREEDKEKKQIKERIQVFEGLVIGRHAGFGATATFTVRKISSGVGVERIFPLHSPNIAKIEVAKKGTVRKAKLNYVKSRGDNQPRWRKHKVRK